MAPRAESIARQGEQTRQAALDAAIELFGEHGYRGCSVAQIARQAGIVQSGLHHHFGSKERLLLEALQEYYPVAAARTDIAAVAEGRTTFAAEIVRVTQENSRKPHLVRFFSVMTGESLTRDHPAGAYFRERYAAIRAAHAHAVCTAEGFDDAASVARVELLVTVAFAAMDGLQLQWLRDPELDIVEGVRLVAEAVEEGLDALRRPRSA